MDQYLSAAFRNYGNVWVERIPLLAEGWRDSLIEAGAPGWSVRRNVTPVRPPRLRRQPAGCRRSHPSSARRGMDPRSKHVLQRDLDLAHVGARAIDPAKGLGSEA